MWNWERKRVKENKKGFRERKSINKKQIESSKIKKKTPKRNHKGKRIKTKKENQAITNQKKKKKKKLRYGIRQNK
jgi:hypothetical protein